jgi:hypothetical protein
VPPLHPSRAREESQGGRDREEERNERGAARTARIMDFVFVRKHASKYGLACLCATRDRPLRGRHASFLRDGFSAVNFCGSNTLARDSTRLKDIDSYAARRVSQRLIIAELSRGNACELERKISLLVSSLA